MSKFLSFLKTTAIGGLLYLLPMIVVGVVLGKAVPVVQSVHETLEKYWPWRTPTGVAMLLILSITIVLLLCFAAGLLARWSVGKWFTDRFERTLILLFPRYLVVKSQVADSIGGDVVKPWMKPVLVRVHDTLRIGLEVDRCRDALVTVYLPGSPDPWSGTVAFIEPDRIEPWNVEFGDAVAVCEQLGRNSARLLGQKTQ